MNYLEQIKEAASYLSNKYNMKPEIGLILGSGLGSLAEEIEDKVYVDYSTIPHFPVSTVEGHKSRFVYGNFMGKKVIAMQGRFHYYEGYTLQEVTFPVRVMKEIGITKMIVTNAAGGVNEKFIPGDLMLITDHLNFLLSNPLMGKNFEELGPRFPDTSRAYSLELANLARSVAKDLNFDIKEGVYMLNSGPSYESPAEVRMARKLGADAVGMSTVPEAIVGAHAKLDVIGISCITNMAAGILDQPLDHSEVVETATRVKEDFEALISNIIKGM